MDPVLVVFLLALLYGAVSLLDRLLRQSRRRPLPTLPRERPAPLRRPPADSRRLPARPSAAPSRLPGSAAPAGAPSGPEPPPPRPGAPRRAPAPRRAGVEVGSLRRRLATPAALGEAVVVAEILRRPRWARRR